MKKLCLIIVTIITFLLSGCNSQEFGKNINSNDLELKYTVYTGSSIWVEITPLVDIQDLKVQVSYYQESNILRQDNEWLEVDFLEKGNTYNLHYDLSNLYPFDRVELYSISGKKKYNSEDFNEKKRTGIIKAPLEDLDTDLFTLRLDTTQKGTTSRGVLYISSPIDLWDVSFEISEFFTDQMPITYIPHDVDKIPANEEISIALAKMISDDGALDSVSLRSAKGRMIEDIIILE